MSRVASHLHNCMFADQSAAYSVNVTDFSVPDASIEGKSAPDARIVLSTYDLQWPSDETLNETAINLNKQSSHSSSQSTHGPQTQGNASEIEDPICMSVLDNAIIWPNVTNEYESGSSCESLFGQECLRAILTDTTYSSDGGCTSPSLNIAACQGVFASTGSYTQSASCKSAIITSSISPPANSMLLPAISGETNGSTSGGDVLYYQYGSASEHSNTTALRQAESQLRMMIITLPNNVKAAACMRVDPSIDDTEVSDIAQRVGWNDSDSSDSASNKSESSSSGGDESAASAQFAATLGSVGLVGLAVAVFGML